MGKLNGRQYYWKCKCDCGNETIVLGTSLRTGITKSCGCAKYDGLKRYNMKQSEKNKIETGERYGKLTVIEDLGFRDQVAGHKRRWYKCKCDCGNEKEVMGNMLKQGQISSCGKCNFKSCGEFAIKQILENHNINYEYDVVFPQLFQEYNRRLRFDFIIYDETFEKPIRFIEYDGRQHLKGPDTNYWNRSNDTLEIIQERDNIKNQFCIKHKYPLIRIPYTKKEITYEDIFSDKYLLKEE